MDKIILPEIAVTARHGVYEVEKREAQPFLISVELGLDLTPAAEEDDVELTVHYGELYADIVALTVSNHYDLIETLAQHIADVALARDPVEWVRVRVEKCRASHAGHTFRAQVEVERGK